VDALLTSHDHRARLLGVVCGQWRQTRLLLNRDHQSVAILDHADRALYHAKRHGQNLAYCYEDLMASGALSAATVAQGAR